MKTPALFNAKTININVSIFGPGAPGACLTELGGASLEVRTRPIDPDSIPELGAYWPGQGGIYGGIHQYPDGPHHTIYAAKDVGDFAWGERGTETGATHKVNGVLNTTTLRDTDGSFPAAEAASEYTADGHHDFYLPSIGELNHAWQNIPEAFDTSTWYWSSTQRSANTPFTMGFDVGNQNVGVKYGELRVRPVRRLFI